MEGFQIFVSLQPPRFVTGVFCGHIVCVPQQGSTWMVVSASSENAATATQARDLIRGMIESAPVA
jgi:hypothetical protein